MITVAFDTATDRCTVAAARGDQVAHRSLDGARQHATAIFTLLSEVLDDLGGTRQQIGRVLSADGPGSFTGLRVGATVAQALCWRRDVVWEVAPSLLIRAWGAMPLEGGVVLALSDALRGQLYAGCWQLHPVTGVHPVAESAIRTCVPADLVRLPRADRVVGSIPEAVRAAVLAATGTSLREGEAALPDARHLLSLASVPGGTRRVIDPVGWEPTYGRPAEAQVVWEQRHGRPLPDTPHLAR